MLHDGIYLINTRIRWSVMVKTIEANMTTIDQEPIDRLRNSGGALC